MQKGHLRLLSILLGVLFFFVITWWNPFHLSDRAAQVLAIGVLMITWWVTEALPMPAVALIPLVLFPLMGIAPVKEVAPHYANEVIFVPVISSRRCLLVITSRRAVSSSAFARIG